MSIVVFKISTLTSVCIVLIDFSTLHNLDMYLSNYSIVFVKPKHLINWVREVLTFEKYVIKEDNYISVTWMHCDLELSFLICVWACIVIMFALFTGVQSICFILFVRITWTL